MFMADEEDPKDTADHIIFNELRDHQRHVRHQEWHLETCRICRSEYDMVRG
jgi:hypothetical protein